MAKGNSFKDGLQSLREVELSELDFDDIGRWPTAVRIIACILLLIACLAIGYYVIVKGQYTTLQKQERSTEELKQKYEVASRNAANIDEYKQQMERIEHEFSLLVSQLPNDTEVPGLLDDITDEGIGNGLEFSSIGLKPEVNEDVYIELPIQIDVRGGYHNIASFISGIASLPRIVTVHDFSIKPESPGSPILNMNLLAKTYRYNENQSDDTATVSTAQN